MHPKDADGMANSVDPDQTAPLGAVWSGSALFAQTYLSENLASLRYLSAFELGFQQDLPWHTYQSVHGEILNQPHCGCCYKWLVQLTKIHWKCFVLNTCFKISYTGLTSGTSYNKDFIRSAKLLHWNGHFKPWGRASQHTDVWDRYYLQDPTGELSPVRKSGWKKSVIVYYLGSE